MTEPGKTAAANGASTEIPVNNTANPVRKHREPKKKYPFNPLSLLGIDNRNAHPATAPDADDKSKKMLILKVADAKNKKPVASAPLPPKLPPRVSKPAAAASAAFSVAPLVRDGNGGFIRLDSLPNPYARSSQESRKISPLLAAIEEDEEDEGEDDDRASDYQSADADDDDDADNDNDIQEVSRVATRRKSGRFLNVDAVERFMEKHNLHNNAWKAVLATQLEENITNIVANANIIKETLSLEHKVPKVRLEKFHIMAVLEMQRIQKLKNSNNNKK
jgi:hypothetical protein